MTSMRHIDLRQATVLPPGLGLVNLHTIVPGMSTDAGFFQQGDLLIKLRKEAFVGQRLPASSSLAVNASTGASHRAIGDVRVFQTLDNAGNPVPDLLLLEVGPGGARIVHNGGSDGHTHGDIPLPAGGYDVTGVVEIDPFAAQPTVLRAAD